MEFSILFKTHPPHPPSMEKKIKITWSKNHFLSNNKHFGKKIFFPIEKVKIDLADLAAIWI